MTNKKRGLLVRLMTWLGYRRVHIVSRLDQTIQERWARPTAFGWKANLYPFGWTHLNANGKCYYSAITERYFFDWKWADLGEEGDERRGSK